MWLHKEQDPLKDPLGSHCCFEPPCFPLQVVQLGLKFLIKLVFHGLPLCVSITHIQDQGIHAITNEMCDHTHSFLQETITLTSVRAIATKEKKEKKEL